MPNKKNKLGFDNDCRNIKNQVISLGKLVQKYPNDPVIYGNFIRMKKLFKRTVKRKYRETKNRLMNKIIQAEVDNPKEFWKLLSKLKNNRDLGSSPISLNDWSEYFCSLHNNSLAKNCDEKFIDAVHNRLNILLKIDKKGDPFGQNISIDEFRETVKKLKSNKSCGPDGISNEMIKSGMIQLSNCILKLFDMILLTESTPDEWATSFIVPLHKGGTDTVPSNYRGLSVTSCLGKLFSAILNNRLSKSIEENNMLSNAQIGFKKHKRTSDHIFVLKSIIEQCKSRRKPIYACFVDLKKAYDTVWREGLFFKLLHNYNVSPIFVRILDSMYKNIRGTVKMDGILGSLFDITIGLRQGCNLSPQLFNLYIDDLAKLLDRISNDPVTLNGINIPCLLYADDMLLLSTTKSGLQKSLTALEIYCDKWQLVVNTTKTKIMVFNNTSKPEFHYKGENLEVVEEYTYLGLLIHKSGNFTKAIKDLAMRARRAFYSLKYMLKECAVSPKLFMKLFDSLVRPILLYCSEVWGDFP